MTQQLEQQLEQQLKKVAIFDGWVNRPHDGSIFYVRDHQLLTIGELQYHTNWQWLMPVVEKICQQVYEAHEMEQNDGTFVTEYDRCHLYTFGMIDDKTGEYMVRFKRSGLFKAPTLIEAAWLAVVDNITSLYDQQTEYSNGK